jgi:hypothetical protein
VNEMHPYDAHSGGRFQKSAVPEDSSGARHNTVYFPLSRTAPAGLYAIVACRNGNAAPPTAYKFFLYDGTRRVTSRTGTLNRSACADLPPYKYTP